MVGDESFSRVRSHAEVAASPGKGSHAASLAFVNGRAAFGTWAGGLVSVSLFSVSCGRPAERPGDANIVPVAVNARVYVATDQALAIFGLGPRSSVHLANAAKLEHPADFASDEHAIYAIVSSIQGDRISAKIRNGQTLIINASEADRTFSVARRLAGHALLARETFDGTDMMHANTILHTMGNAAFWRPNK